MESILGSLDFALSVIIGLALLVILVVVHELGHAIVARRNGVVVEEFGIGFPPQAWKKKLKNGVLFTLNWLPLGGFVKLKGENDAAKEKGSYGAAGLWAKTKILLAGVAVNWITAAAIFTILALVGIPKVLPDQFSVSADTTEVRQPVQAVFVAEDTPAAATGIVVGDEILTIAGESVETPEKLQEITKGHAGETVEVVYRQQDNGQTLTKTVKLTDGSDPEKGYLGIASSQQATLRSTWSAPIVGVGTTVQFTVVTLDGIGQLFVNLGKGLASKLSTNEQTRDSGAQALEEAGANVAGPIGILGTIFPQAREAGLVILLFLTGIISLTLATINILPIPALDGGRLFVTLLFRLLRKPLTKEIEERIQATGFVVLIGLIILVTIVDVGRITGN
jgi:regulator of sigma E protease